MKPGKSEAKGQTLSGHAVPISKLLAYQKGSIVSREIVRRQAGTVTLFAFDSGQGLSEHTAPFAALVLILDGQAVLTIGGKRLRAKKGDLVILPARKPHSLSATRRFKMLLTMIRS